MKKVCVCVCVFTCVCSIAIFIPIFNNLSTFFLSPTLFLSNSVVVGHGVIYSYDAIGSYEHLKYGVQGSAQNHIIPMLDSCVAKRNRNVPYVDLDREEALNLIKEAFTSATEVWIV